MKIALTKELADQYKQVVKLEAEAFYVRQNYDKAIQQLALEAAKLELNKDYLFKHYSVERIGKVVTLNISQDSPTEISICGVVMNRLAKDGSLTSKNANTSVDQILGEA